MRGRLVAIVLILAVGAAALALSWMRPVADISNDKISPSPTPTRHIDYEKVVTKQQVTKFSVETVRADEESKQVRLILLVSSLIVVLAIGLLAYMEWRRRRKRLIRYASLRRRGSDQSLALSAEPFDAQFASKEFREAAQRLRLPIRIPTHDLDVPRTLRATLAAGGAFSLVERQRKQLPEYLALIERRSAHDHLYQLYRLAVDRLRAAGVDIRSYSFGNNPLLLSEDIGADGTGPIVHLETLSALAAGQRVLVFGPSSVLLTPHSRQAPAWLTQFQPWEERALLDSRGYSLGDKGELDLVQAGWLVGLARPESLAALADRVASGRTGGGWLE